MRTTHKRPSHRCATSARRILIACLLSVSGVAIAAHYDFRERDATVTALLESGQRMANSDATRRALDLVGRVQNEAVRAYEAGDTEKGYERLDQAYVLVQTVVRNLAGKPEVSTRLVVPASLEEGDRGRAERFATLAHSITALRAAYRSIRDETTEPGPDVGPEIDRLVQAAHADRDAGRQAEGLRQLKAAYALLQSEIVRLRGGQTLVRELSFASNAEEYAYEVDRHDSHLLLVKLLLSDARKDPQQAAQIEATVDESMRLHWIAHKHAAAGEYGQAVVWLERASDALVALIRDQGFDIPR